MSNPTLSGAETGKVTIAGEVKGGIYFQDDEGNTTNRAAMLRLVREKDAALCLDNARKYLQAKGDDKFLPGQLQRWASLFQLHFALFDPATGKRMFPAILMISDEKGKVDPAAVARLPLLDLADGQMDRLWNEYAILQQTQTPAAVTHEQWEALITEGKTESLKTLHSRHGSSALIQVLHGMAGRVWPE